MTKQSRAHLFMVLQTLIMAPSYVFGSQAAREFPPLFLVSMRAVFAALLFLLALFLTKGHVNLKLSRRESFQILKLSVIGIFINQTSFIVGLSLTSPAHVVMLYALTPLIVFLISVFTRMERLTKLKFLFVSMAVAGTLIVVLSKEAAGDAPNPLLGNIITLTGVIAWSAFLTYSRPMMQKYSPVQLTAMLMLIGAIGFSVLGISFFPQVRWEEITFDGWFGFGYLVVVNSFLSYLLLTSSLQALPSHQVAAYINTQPIAATAIAIAVGATLFQWSFVLGALLCIFAIFGLTYLAK